MALTAGELSIKISANTSDIDKLEKKMSSVSSTVDNTKMGFGKLSAAFAAGNVIVAAASKALGVVVDFAQESVRAFAEAEKIQTRFRAVMSGNITTYDQYAKQIQKTLNIEDDQVTSLLTLAKNYGVSDAQLKNVTNSAIALSKAFGVDLESAVKMATNAQNGEFDALTRFIPALRTTKDLTEQTAIVNEALAKGWQLAAAETETFTGSQEKLKIAIGDLQETFGGMIASVGTPLTSMFADIVNSTNEMIQQPIEKKLEEERLNLVSLLSALQDTTLAEDQRKGILDKIAEINPTVASGINIQKMNYGKLATTIEEVNKQYTNQIALQLINKDIDNIKAKSGEALKKSLEEQIKLNKELRTIEEKVGIKIDTSKSLKDQLVQVKELLYAKLQEKNTMEQNLEILDRVADAEKRLPDILARSNKLRERSKELMAGAIPLQEMVMQLEKELNVKVDDINKNPPEIIVKTEVQSPKIDSKNKETSPDEAFSKLKSQMEQVGDVASVVQRNLQIVTEAVSSLFSSASTVVQSFNEQRLANLDNLHNAELESIQNRLNTELEMIENNGLTRKEFLEKQLSESLSRGDIEAANETKKELSIMDANKKAYDAKKAADKEYALKKYKMDLDMFNAKKAMDIAMIWMNAGIGIAGAWSGVGQVPPFAVPAAIIQAAILTGIITTMAGVQTGLTAAQQPPPAPAFATGGIVGGAGSFGSNDQVNARVNNGEMILNGGQQQNLLDMINRGSGGNMTVQVFLDGMLMPVNKILLQQQKNEALRTV